MQDQPFTMDIEHADGTIKQHGFHLGTDLKVAEFFVKERLQHEAVSVALRRNKKLVRIYDYRDLDDA